MDADVGAIVSQANAKCEQERVEKHCRRILEVLNENEGVISKNKIRELAGLNANNVQRAIDVLLSGSQIYKCKVVHPGNKKPLSGYRLAEETSNENSALYCGAEDVVGGGV